jgi:hypothetical protein
VKVKKFSDTLESDREFEFAGEVFQWTYVHWDVLTGIVDGAGSNGKEPTATESIRQITDAIPQFLDEANDGPKRMGTLLEGKSRPVPIGQVNALYEWLLEVTSGRPTETPSPSEAGRGKTAASSKAA